MLSIPWRLRVLIAFNTSALIFLKASHFR